MREAERARERESERWLRGVGLPAFVRAGGGDRLLGRVVPFLVFLFVFGLMTAGLESLTFEIEVDSELLVAFLAALLVVVVMVFVTVPIAVAAFSARWLRRRPGWEGPAGIVLLALYLVGLPLLTLVREPLDDALVSLLSHIVLTAVAFLLTWLGVSSLLAWAARAALTQLSAVGALVTRALPILMLVIVFAFFSRPVWEVTSTMSPARLLAVGVFFALLGLLFVLPIGRTEMRELDQTIAAGDRIASVRAAGLDDLVPYASEPGPPLGRLERLNLWSVLVVALALQTLLFAAIVFAVLMLLGGVAFSAEVLEEWVGDRLTHLEVLGAEIPFTWALVKTSLFLSFVSSLNFLVSVVTNSTYRNAFFHPLVREARSALAVRAAYLRRRSGAAPADAATVEAADVASAPVAGHATTVAAADDENELGMIEPGPGSAG